jgi:hypothetical protein
MTKDEMISLLERNDVAVARALVVLNERQTPGEQNTKNTRRPASRCVAPRAARACVARQLIEIAEEKAKLKEANKVDSA